jgi:hypothetical protein
LDWIGSGQEKIFGRAAKYFIFLKENHSNIILKKYFVYKNLSYNNKPKINYKNFNCSNLESVYRYMKSKCFKGYYYYYAAHGLDSVNEKTDGKHQLMLTMET